MRELRDEPDALRRGGARSDDARQSRRRRQHELAGSHAARRQSAEHAGWLRRWQAARRASAPASASSARTPSTIVQGYIARTGSFNLSHTQGRLDLQLGVQGVRNHRDVGRGSVMWDEALFNPALGRNVDSTGRQVFLPTEDGLLVNPVMAARAYQRGRSIGRTCSARSPARSSSSQGLKFNVAFGPQFTNQTDGELIGIYTRQKRGTGAPDATARRTQNNNYTLSQLPRLRPHDRRAPRAGHGAVRGRKLQDGVRQRGRARAAVRQPALVQPRHRLHADTERPVHADGASVVHGTRELHVPRSLHRSRRPAATTAPACSPRVTSSRSSRRRRSAGRSATSRSCSVVPSVSDLKLRLSYGRVGNSAIGAYQTLGLLSRRGTRAATNYLTASGRATIPNPEPQVGDDRQVQRSASTSASSTSASRAASTSIARTRTTCCCSRALPYTSGYSSVLRERRRDEELGVEVARHDAEPAEAGTASTGRPTSSGRRTRTRSSPCQSGLTADVGNVRWVGQPINVYFNYQYVGLWQIADSALARTTCGCKVGRASASPT